MERPGLQKLLDDVRAKRIDVVVVYKIDRLTRSLTDFARIVEVFDEHQVSFVSVTQQFNTTTSMGRLTLNVLLSFAQFEREVTAERIRDKIAASKQKGMWMGGVVPLGYDARDKKLVVNEAEAETVRTLFRLYLELGTVRQLKDEADRRGIVTKHYVQDNGIARGGKPFSRGHLYQLLATRIYRGLVSHRGATYPGPARGHHRPRDLGRCPGSARRQRIAANQRHQRDRPASCLPVWCSTRPAIGCHPAMRSRTASAIATTSHTGWFVARAPTAPDGGSRHYRLKPPSWT